MALKNLTLDHLEPERNCDVAGSIAAQISYFLDQAILSTSLPPVSDLLTFLYACSNTTLGKLSPGDAVDWYIYHRASNPNALDDLWRRIVHTSSVCQESYCRHYKWEDDPDLAGIGVSTNPSTSQNMFLLHFMSNPQRASSNSRLLQVYYMYTIQAYPTTLCVIFELEFFLLLGLSSTQSTQGAASCRDILGNFVKISWSAPLYFALAITIASNLAIKPTMSTYGMTFSPWFVVIGEHFATMVLICLWPWYSRKTFPECGTLMCHPALGSCVQ